MPNKFDNGFKYLYQYCQSIMFIQCEQFLYIVDYVQVILNGKTTCDCKKLNM